MFRKLFGHGRASPTASASSASTDARAHSPMDAIDRIKTVRARDATRTRSSRRVRAFATRSRRRDAPRRDARARDDDVDARPRWFRDGATGD